MSLAVIDGVNTATKTTSYIHTDHLSRPTRMTGATKATVWQASWTPWGEPQSISGTVTQNLRFPGQYFQIETGLAYNWHRHYDPVTGRYTQPDPLRFVDGPSVYAYAGNSPFVNTDREGLAFDPKNFSSPVPEYPHSSRPSNNGDQCLLNNCYLVDYNVAGPDGGWRCHYRCFFGVHTIDVGPAGGNCPGQIAKPRWLE